MIGQRHYVISREVEGRRQQYWRGRRGLARGEDGWTWDLSAARSYRRSHDALRAAKQLDSDSTLEVCEIEAVVARVCYRVRVESPEAEEHTE